MFCIVTGPAAVISAVVEKEVVSAKRDAAIKNKNSTEVAIDITNRLFMFSFS